MFQSETDHQVFSTKLKNKEKKFHFYEITQMM